MLPQRAKLFEFSAAVAVIGLCAYFLLATLQQMEEEAERVVVEATLRNINTGVRFAQAQLIVQGRERELVALYSGSPVQWLERPPPDYVELDRVSDADYLPGRWVWEKQSGTLSYTPRQGARLKIDGGSMLQWRWNSGTIKSLRAGLQPVRPYEWAAK